MFFKFRKPYTETRCKNVYTMLLKHVEDDQLQFHHELKKLRKIALRMGYLKEKGKWQIHPERVKELLKGEITITDLHEIEEHHSKENCKMLKSCVTLGLAALLLAGCASTLRTPAPSGGQSPLTMKRKITKTVICHYLLYLPEGYPKAQKKWPLMLFLHGAGERGDSLDLVKKHGPTKLADRGKKLPFIVVSPQCPANEWWSIEVLDALLKEVVSRYEVDEDRIVVTGLSMGGFGTWTFATAYPDRFAAIAPICGGGNPLEACKLKNLPVWVFHGAKDPVVPLKSSQDMVDALKACGGNVLFTVYPDADHDSWTATYDNPEFWDWMLKQRRTP